MPCAPRLVPSVAVPSALVFVVAVGGVSEAWAHIDLLEPEARAHGTAARGDTDVDANSNLKQGPCGQVETGRTERVATYVSGETITVRVREENAHVSYIRISIDLDGEEFLLRAQTPPGPETQEEAAAAEAALNAEGLLAVYREDNDTPGFVHDIEVTLPRASCDNCTLQVLQYMYDDPAAPYYFQCADLVLAPRGAAADSGAEDDVPVPPSGGGSGSAEPVAPLGNGAAGMDSVASAPSGANGGEPARDGVPSASAPVMSADSIDTVTRSRGAGCSVSRGGQSLRLGVTAAGVTAALIALRSRCMRRRIRARARTAS